MYLCCRSFIDDKNRAVIRLHCLTLLISTCDKELHHFFNLNRRHVTFLDEGTSCNRFKIFSAVDREVHCWIIRFSIVELTVLHFFLSGQNRISQMQYNYVSVKIFSFLKNEVQKV
jgi:hypothetical protein